MSSRRATLRRTKTLGAEPRAARVEPGACWLCARPLGQRVEWHHPQPKSRGGRVTVPVHPICHRTVHVCFSNADLARIGQSPAELAAAQSDFATFLAWIADKPPDFHAPTRRRRKI